MDLLLFERAPERVAAAVAAGVRDFVCDWETRGKGLRQEGAGLEENCDTPDDVRAVRRLAPGRVVCRVNAVWDGSAAEVDTAVGAGASLVLFPMVRGPAEVARARELVAGRAQLGILVETRDALERAAELGREPVDMVYVGFNDLRLERRTSLFAPFVDGTVDRLREAFPHAPFGFAGLTAIDRGAPLPCRLLLAEMARLDCTYAFLRRSFKRDIEGSDAALVVARLHQAWAYMRARGAAEIEADRQELVRRAAAL